MKLSNILVVFVTILCLLWSSGQSDTGRFDDMVFLIVLILFGIPHGAIDHLIAMRRSDPGSSRKWKFYSLYLGLMVLTAIVWLALPTFAFYTFLIFSAYHFGQSQLYYVPISSLLGRLGLFSLWGLYFFFSLFYFNLSACVEILNTLGNWEIGEIFGHVDWYYFWLLGSILLMCSFTALLVCRKMKPGQFLFEVAAVLMLTFLAKWSSVILAFAVYFGLWHSLRSMILEYRDLKDAFDDYSILSFIKQLVPFSVLGLLFMIGTYFVLLEVEVGISPYVVFIIVISSLTVPHMVVMDKLYSRVAS